MEGQTVINVWVKNVTRWTRWWEEGSAGRRTEQPVFTGPHADSHGPHYSRNTPERARPWYMISLYKENLVMSEQRKQMFPQHQGASALDPCDR